MSDSPKIDIDNRTAVGVYSNITSIKHTPIEFILDFLLFVEENNTAIGQSRVRISPVHAKSLLKSLAENIRNYEDKFGTVYNPENVNPLIVS